MTIPQARITGSLDSALDLFDSADPAIDFLQIVDAVVSIEPWKTQGYSLYYDSAGDLPIADSATEGMMVLTASVPTGNSTLYYSTGTNWAKINDFAKKPISSIPSSLKSGIQYAASNRIYAYGTDRPQINPATVNSVESYPVATPFTTSSNVGSLAVVVSYLSGASDYSGGGKGLILGGFPLTTSIQSHNYSSGPISVVDTGDVLAEASYRSAATSSYTSAYLHSGYNSPTITTDNIQKYPFAGGSNASFIGDLTPGPGVPGNNLLSFTYADGQQGIIKDYTRYQQWPFASDTPFSTNIVATVPSVGNGWGYSTKSKGYFWSGGVSEEFNFSNGTPVSVTPFSITPNAPSTVLYIAGNGNSETKAFWGTPNPGPTGPFSLQWHSFPFASGVGQYEGARSTTNRGIYGGAGQD
jgi:hypothetical protein